MKNKRLNDFTTGPVTKQLVLFTLPLLLSTLLQIFYNAADRAVAGLYGGEIALAAVGSTGNATALLLGLVNGLSAAANVVISNFLGARREKEKQDAMHTSMLIAAVCGAFMALVGVLLSKPILRLMNSPEDVIDGASLYMRIFLAGTPFSMIYNFGSAILRAHGDTTRPTMILSITGILNVLFNLFFAIVCHMPVAGVALATIIAQAVSAAWVVWILFDPKDEFKMEWKSLRFHKQHLNAIVRIGIPCGFNPVVFNLANTLLQSTINTFGATVIAGNVAADSINTFVYAIPSSLYTACVSFSGQCYGASKYDRLTKAIRGGMLTGGTLTVIGGVLIIAFPRVLLGFFATDPAVIDAGISKLFIMSLTILPYTCGQVLMGVLRGMRKSTGPTAINALAICLPRILWVMFIFPLNPTTLMLYLCLPISNVLDLIALAVYYSIHQRKLAAEQRQKTLQA
ncbi:MAG: MATE family efflux transporter [Oscillospiraceae bacterium]|nr:MATE family efflux transporter [Oscillospiraceae bacterium]